MLTATRYPFIFTLYPQITSDDPKAKALVEVNSENDPASSEQLAEGESQAAPVPYSYPKFHLAFCFASCFLSMQLSNWLERCV